MSTEPRPVDSEHGWTWAWTSEPDIEHQLEWIPGRRMWLRHTRAGDGGWTSSEAPRLPVVDDRDAAQDVVVAVVEQEKGSPP